MTTRPLFFLLVLAAVTGACGSEEDLRDPVWGYISPVIIQPNCATSSCHSKGAAVAGLDLSTAQAGYNSLMAQKLPPVMGGQPTRSSVTRRLVTPGNPTESRIVNMMRAYGAPRMPPDRPLSEADIALVEQWILAGANND